MYIIPETPNPSGAYPSPQTWSSLNIPEGYAVIPDEFDLADFYAHNGFVTLEMRDGKVTGMTPKLSAWEAWKAEHPSEPEPEPELSPEERIIALEQEKADRIDVQAVWDQMAAAYIEGVQSA